MKATLRIGIAALAAATVAGWAPAAAQDVPVQSNSPTPATDSIGPRDLRSFSLPGTVTRPAETQAAPASGTPARAASSASPPPAAAQRNPAPTPQREAAAAAAPAGQRRADQSQRAGAQPTSAAEPTPTSSVSVSLPPSDALSGDAPPPATATDFAPAPETPSSSPSLVPWLLALLAVLGGGGFLFYRQRMAPQLAPAGVGSEVRGNFDTPTPARPKPQAPEPAPAPKSPGIVTTRLRPWLEVDLKPLRCVVDEHSVTIEFAVGVMNSGSSPARDILIEGGMFNAGPTQDEELRRFFDQPVGQGSRIPVLQPMQKIEVKSAIGLPREQLRLFEAAGRRFVVPLLGLNVLYNWSGGEGQSSVAYLVGKETKEDKLAPFRMDLGARIFRGLGARESDVRIRR